MNLWLKLIRDVKQSAGQCLTFVLVVAAGAFFYTGLVTLSDNLGAYSKAYYAKHNLSDLNVYYSRITAEELAVLREVDGIHTLEGRYTFDAKHYAADNKSTVKIHSIPVPNEINTSAVLEGRLPSGKNEIFLDARYAQAHHYTVGDEVSLHTQAGEMKFILSGVGENVEHAKKNATQDHLAYGIGYVSEAAIPEVAGSLYYNDVMIDARDSAELHQLGQAIEAKSQSLAYIGQVSKERTFSYSQLQATLHNNRLMSTVVPLVLFMIEAMILFLAMSRIIDSERSQVGIMKALGVRNGSIMLHYMGYPVLVGIIGSVVGFAVAAWVFVPIIETSNARSYSLPGIQFPLSLSTLLPPLLISSAFGMLASYLSGRAILKERAAQAMRPKPPRRMRQILLEKIPGLWSRLPYSSKLIWRNIFLNKQRALASTAGIVVSTVLLITALGTQTALQRVASQIEEVYSYDLRVDYTAGAVLDMATLPEGIARHYDLSTMPVELRSGQQTEQAELVVTSKENDLIHFYDEHDNRITLEDHGVLVPKSYADQYKISAGDQIRIAFAAPELNNQVVDMKVISITTQYSNPSFYITPDYLESFGLTYRPTSIVVEADSVSELASIRSFLEQEAQVEDMTDKTNLRLTAQYIMKQNNFVFIMFIICAVILSFGAIYTISSINIYERNRELATLKVLGYQKNQINRLIFVENSVLTVFSIIIAWPISHYMYKKVVQALSSTHQQIPDQLNVSTILIAVVLALSLTLLSNLLLRRKVTRIHMIEALKGVE